MTDASGNPVGEQRYYPYGETRFTSGTIYTDKLFTGQREITGLGIYHYGARFYSQKLGRFLSPDSIVPGAANPQAWNRYSYVLGNPLRYTDPTGHAFYEDPYQSSDGTCSAGDTSCNWVGTGNNNNGSGNPNNNNGNHSEDNSNPNVDDNQLEPEPEVCSSSMCNPNITWPFPTGTPPTTQAGSSKPDWGKIALGIGVVLMSTLVVGVIVAGVLATGPAAPIVAAELIISTEYWISMVYVGAMIYGWSVGFDMIADGYQGE